MSRTGQRTVSTFTALIYIAIPVALATLAIALMATGKGEGVAIGALLMVFCVWRVIASIRWWAQEMR